MLHSSIHLLLMSSILILSGLSIHATIHPYQSIHSLPVQHRSLYAIRGGAFFGFGNKKSTTKPDDDPDTPKRFPALSQSEIEEKLSIPIYGITDLNGNGVILNDGGEHIFHFFLSRHMAEAASKAVSASNTNAPELKVSVFHLGKCWFRLIESSGEKNFTLQKCGDHKGKDTTKPIHFRLVPNMKDLMGARVLTGLQPGDVQSLKDSVETANPSAIISVIQKASTQSTGFTQPFNQVPVFAIAQMRVRRKDEHGNPSGNAMLPMHLSTKTMADTWSEFITNSPQFSDADATLQLVELHNLIKMMQADSDFDFRNVVFITPTYDQNNNEIDEDEESDDDDDGGGGDNGMMANAYQDEISVESFVSYSGHTLAGVQI